MDNVLNGFHDVGVGVFSHVDNDDKEASIALAGGFALHGGHQMVGTLSGVDGKAEGTRWGVSQVVNMGISADGVIAPCTLKKERVVVLGRNDHVEVSG